MSDLHRSARNVGHRIRKLEKQVEAIKNSNLTAEEKQKALNSLKKTLIATTIFVVAVTLFLGVSVVKRISNGGDTGVILMTGSIVAAIVLLIVYALIARKTISKNFTMYYEKVNLDFDGMDEQEINRLKPAGKEDAIIKKYKVKRVLYAFILALVLGIWFYAILNLGVSVKFPIVCIITLVIFFVWLGFDDSCKVEIHRIKSGRYKRGFGFRCKKCKTVLNINFDEMETYMNADKNEHGLRVTQCKNCDNLITLYNLETYYNEYKKYLEQTK